MSELFVTREAFESAKNIIIQYLRDAGYTGSLEDGTGIYDAVIKPNALLYTLYGQQLRLSQAYMSLDRAQALQESLSKDEYDAAVDAVLSNWFVTRNQGATASGTVRLFFSRCPDYLGYIKGTVVGSCNSAVFLAADTIAFGEADFKSTVNTTSNVTEYYADVPVVARDTGHVDIQENAVFTAQVSNIYFVRATAVSAFTSGEDIESSDAFIARTRKAITTRELITERAINTVLPDEFPELHTLYTAGHGASEMMRDVVEFQGVKVHVGNMADLWVASELTRATEECLVGADGAIELKNNPVHIVEIIDNETKASVPFTLRVDPLLWLRPGTAPASLTVQLPEPEPGPEEETEPGPSTGGASEQTWSSRYTDANGNDVHYTVTLTVDEEGHTTSRTVTTTTLPDGSEQVTTRVVVDDGETLTTTYTDAEGHTTTTTEPIEGNEDEEDDGGTTEEDVRTVTVVEYTSTLPRRVADFVFSETQRVASYDPQVRMKVPVLMTLRLKVSATSHSDETAAAIQQAALDYVYEIQRSGGLWVESEMVQRIHAAVPEVQKIVLPVEAAAQWFDPGDSKYKQVALHNTLELTGATRQVTPNTVQLYLDRNSIAVEFC